ncbi:hypothetical protein [Taibaiella koreensis]|uniref:hypothetical protein n=1 Tax=Taibaiella koreensis TaxID=1268548 RepID=UPI000E59E1A3|nr:hypothetical protein [Taibaiella koreensis]
MDRIFLSLISILAPLWRLAGADSRQLLHILRLKTTLSNRAPVSLRSGSKKQYNFPPLVRSLLNMLLPALLGITYVPMLLLVPDKEVGLLLVTFSYFLFATLLLVMTFSSQLTDTADNVILLPRPVNSRTMILYRLLFMAYKFLASAIPLSFAPAIALGIRDGWMRGLYYLALTLPGLTIVFAAIQLLLIVVLRFVSGQRFKKLVYWLQIIFIGWVYLCMQRSFLDKLERTDLSVVLQHTTLLSWMPQYWITEAWMHTAPWWMYLALWGGPVICFLFIVRILAPKFSERLSEMGSGFETASRSSIRKARRATGQKSYLLLKHPAAKAGFQFVRKFTGRVTEYKMMVLPAYAYVIFTAFPLLSDIWKLLSTGAGHIKASRCLFPVYMLMYPITTALMNLKASPQYKAAWVYEVAPGSYRGYVRQGAGWGLFTRYYIPAFLIWSVILLAATKGALWSDLVLTGCTCTAIYLLQVLLLFKEMPASIPAEDLKAQKSQRFFVTLLIMLLSVVAGMVHAFLIVPLYWWIHLLLAAMSLAAAWLLWDKIARKA